jgi:hypothetical protein
MHGRLELCVWGLVVMFNGKRPLATCTRVGKDSIKIVFKKWDWEAGTGLNWLRIGTSYSIL